MFRRADNIFHIWEQIQEVIRLQKKTKLETSFPKTRRQSNKNKT